MKSVVCLPTRNEKNSIAIMIKEIRKIKVPVFVSDENSNDGTKQIAKKLKVPVYQRDCSGKGCGVQKAIQVAIKQDYDILIFIDCDCTYPVDAIPKMIKMMDSYDMVVGARDFKNVPSINKIGNIVHTWAINILYFTYLKDINSGLRAMNVKKFKGLISAQKFDVEAQITVQALKNGMKVKEIPIKYEKRVGESKLRVRDGISILWRIIAERFS